MEERKITNSQQYYDHFKVENETGTINGNCSDKSKNALKYAYDIHKFEIELYWKRASYFWVLIGAALVAYIAVVASDSGNYKRELSVVISCLGLVFSCAWLAVNKGSKFWQDHWENHVDMLEDEHIGPLYKIVFNNDKSFWNYDGGRFSVSRINLAVSFYVMFLWIGLLSASVVSMFLPMLLKEFISVLAVLFAAATIFSCVYDLSTGICKTNIDFDTGKRKPTTAILREHPLTDKVTTPQ